MRGAGGCGGGEWVGLGGSVGGGAGSGLGGGGMRAGMVVLLTCEGGGADVFCSSEGAQKWYAWRRHAHQKS